MCGGRKELGQARKAKKDSSPNLGASNGSGGGEGRGPLLERVDWHFYALQPFLFHAVEANRIIESGEGIISCHDPTTPKSGNCWYPFFEVTLAQPLWNGSLPPAWRCAHCRPQSARSVLLRNGSNKFKRGLTRKGFIAPIQKKGHGLHP